MLEDSPNTNNKVQALSRRVAEAAISIAEPVPEEPEFLHAVLCQLGLPRSETKARVFERNTGGASLRIEAGSWYNGARYQEMPLPYGANSEASRPLVPTHSGHPFRRMAATHSDRSRPPLR